MKFAEVLRPEACVEVGARTKAEALRELAEALAEADAKIDREELTRELVAREERGSTGIGDPSMALQRISSSRSWLR